MAEPGQTGKERILAYLRDVLVCAKDSLCFPYKDVFITMASFSRGSEVSEHFMG